MDANIYIYIIGLCANGEQIVIENGNFSELVELYYLDSFFFDKFPLGETCASCAFWLSVLLVSSVVPFGYLSY